MVTIIVYVFAAGIAGYELVYSSLAAFFKKIFFLDREYTVLKGLASPKLIFKAFGLLAIVLMPVVALCLIHRFIYSLLQCPFCTAFHLCWLICYYHLNLSMPLSFACGFIAMFFTSLYNLIRMHSI